MIPVIITVVVVAVGVVLWGRAALRMWDRWYYQEPYQPDHRYTYVVRDDGERYDKPDDRYAAVDGETARAQAEAARRASRARPPRLLRDKKGAA